MTAGALAHHAAAERTFWHCSACDIVFVAPVHWLSPEDEIARYRHHQNDAGDPRYIEFLSRLARPVIARTAVGGGGELPCEEPALLALPGVGPKCAHLALGIACGATLISVDIHVHRVTNRWGYVAASTPEKTMAALEAKLPKRYWIEINRLLVPFGKHICTGNLPHCSTCPVLEMCQQVGVKAHR